ncbi:MAG: acetylxylan esterase [Bacteroidia bacterium]|nr:acetylxylan esterase [Bacteroidia bacterium]
MKANSQLFYKGICFLFVFFLFLSNTEAQTPDFRKMTPEERAAYRSKLREDSEKDWLRMMTQLDIKIPVLPTAAEDTNRPKNLFQKPGSTNWSDSIGNTYVRSGWGNWSNYDESKAGKYKLPDPLVLKNGKPVKNAKTWWNERRPEILYDFCSKIYGKIPNITPKVVFKVTAIDTIDINGKVIKKTIVGQIDNSKFPKGKSEINITLYLPLKSALPVPLMVIADWGSANFTGGNNQGPTAQAMVLGLGWGYATVNTSAIQMDSGAGLNDGIIGIVNQGNQRKTDDWGVLAAWSWGLSRALDYFETDKAINPKQIGIQGHSRWGKTALLAGALDQRWAIVFSSCSGSMGASLEMRSWGENIDNVAGSGEYHWMAGNFLKYAGHWNEMPVDAHELMALVAPRPLFITGGTHDQWSDPHGEFLACVGADPVYRLLGAQGLGTLEMPAPDVSLISGELAFRNHEGGHTDLIDWPVFLEFAKKYFK